MILTLLPYLVNGAMSLAVMRAMRARGLDVTVAYFLEQAPGYTRDPCEDFARDGRLVSFSSEDPWNYGRAISALAADRDVGLILQIGPPWAYEHLPFVKQALPSVQLVDTLYNPVGHTVNHFLFERCFDGVIVESQQMRRFVEACTLKADAQVQLVESGVDLDAYSPRPRGADGPELIVGYVGRMSPEKNPLGFVDLAEALGPRLPNLRFRMFGEGAMEAEVKRRVASSQLGDAISDHGYVDHPRDAFEQIDVLVVCSKLDGRPNAVMEANGCGVPVIGSPVGGIPELIEDGVNGYVIDPRDFDRLQRELGRLVASNDARQALRLSSRQAAEVRFDRRRMMDDYEAAFRRFLLRHEAKAAAAPSSILNPAIA